MSTTVLPDHVLDSAKARYQLIGLCDAELTRLQNELALKQQERLALDDSIAELFRKHLQIDITDTSRSYQLDIGRGIMTSNEQSDS